MAAMKASEVCIAFIRECSAKIEDYTNFVLEQDNWLEELYLDSRNKLTASVEGNIILPKTPATKRVGRHARKYKQPIPEELLEVVDDKENAADDKENLADEPRCSQEHGNKADAGNKQEKMTPVLSKSGRAASKAANAKIKESQRLLNDLSSKRRRPSTDDKPLTTVETAQTCKRKNARRDNSDSGVYDRYSTCSNSSTTSTRSARNQKGANSKHGSKAAQHKQSVVVEDGLGVLVESSKEKDISTNNEQKVKTPADGKTVDFVIRLDEVVVGEEATIQQDVNNSSDKVRKRSSLSHMDEPSRKISKTNLSSNSVSNNLADLGMVCRVDPVSLEATSVNNTEPSTAEVLHSTNSRRSRSFPGRRTRSSSTSIQDGQSLCSTSSVKLNTDADNLKGFCNSSERQDCEQVIDIIQPPQEFSQTLEEPICHEQPEFKQPELPPKSKPIKIRSPPKPQPRTTRTKTRNVENQEQQHEVVELQQQQDIMKLKQQQQEVVKQQEVVQQQQQEVIKQQQLEVVKQLQLEDVKQQQLEVVKQQQKEAVKQQLVTSAEDRLPPRVTRTKKRPVEEITDCPRPRRDSSVCSLQSESSTRSTRTKKRKLEQQQQDQVVAKPVLVSAVSSKDTEVCLILSDSEDEQKGSYNSTKAVGSSSSTESSQGKVVLGKTNPKMLLIDQVNKKSPLPAKNTFSGSDVGNNSKKFISALGKVEESVSDSCPNVVSVWVSPLHGAVIKSAASPRGISKQQAQLLGDCITDDEVDHKTVSDRDVTNGSQESFDETEEEEEEEEEDEEQEEEPELLLQPPRRMTRSKVRLQEQQVSSKAESPGQTGRHLAAAAAKSKKQMVTTGKFSPRPFSNRTGVKQLAAAYDHVVSVSTPLAKGQSRGLSRDSSTSRLPPNTSSRFLNTPQTLNRVKALNPSGLSSSSDSHHYRHISKVVTPSHSNRPKNLVTGIKSFLSSSIAVQSVRPTREELQELKEEDIRRKMEKEEEILRKREERLRTKGIETKKRNEDRLRKVQEARMANERKAAELKESLEKEKKEQQLREKKLREEKMREELFKKKQALLKKAEEEKRKREEEVKRKEEEAERRREEAEDRRRQEAARKAALLKQQEEQRMDEQRLVEEEMRAEVKRKMVEEKQRREAERQAREKEELRVLKEREAARLATAAANQQQQKQLTVTPNQTFDANSTYTVGGNANATYTAAPGGAKSGITPKTPASTNRPESYEMTPAQDVNDYGIDDLKSEDSSDDDSNPKKKVPKWATRLELNRTLVKQEYSSLSLDKVFPCQELLILPDLNMIFKIKRSRFKIRSSSAHWTTPPHKIFSTNSRPDT